jgi:hypothetical protein
MRGSTWLLAGQLVVFQRAAVAPVGKIDLQKMSFEQKYESACSYAME